MIKMSAAASLLAAWSFMHGCTDEGQPDRLEPARIEARDIGKVDWRDDDCSGSGGLSVDWGDESSYDAVMAANMEKGLEIMDPLGFMLKLRNTSVTGRQSAVLWQGADNPIDAAVHNVIEFPYFIQEETVEIETPNPGSGEMNPWQTRNDNGKDPSYGDPPSSGACISGTSYPVNSCAGHIPWQEFHFSWLNYCPHCGGIGTLAWEGVPEQGGIYCTVCDVDACAVSGFGTTCVGGIGNAPPGSCTPACETRLTPCPSTLTETITTTPHQNPFLFDLEITYFKDGESMSTGHVVHVGFTGHSGGNIIGSVTPQLVPGMAGIFYFDLKEALDAADPGAHYYVKKIALTHTMSPEQLSNIESRRMGFGTLRVHDGS